VTELGWLTCELGDVPRHDRWLSKQEGEVLSELRVPKRRDDWLLGRWTGKAAVAAWRGVALGCDLEAIEPRSEAFLREWLRPAERELVSAQNGEARDLAANLIWTAKEAASKARREGLRLNLRRATVEAEGLAQRAGSWARLQISWEGGPVELGWWRHDAGWVMTVTSDQASEAAPIELS
jgi:4'-phosphopantetheinyl transferase EntD